MKIGANIWLGRSSGLIQEGEADMGVIGSSLYTDSKNLHHRQYPPPRKKKNCTLEWLINMTTRQAQVKLDLAPRIPAGSSC
jgi:hypothetical protein